LSRWARGGCACGGLSGGARLTSLGTPGNPRLRELAARRALRMPGRASVGRWRDGAIRTRCWAPRSGARGSTQTTRFDGSAATATAGNPVQPVSGFSPGRCGPASDSNHIDLPLGTRSTTTGSSKKDALRRCITTMGHRHVRISVAGSINKRYFERCKYFFGLSATFFAGVSRAHRFERPRERPREAGERALGAEAPLALMLGNPHGMGTSSHATR
jgi:hypothetical protein